MEWLNYHHLYYFWAVAREGSIVRAVPLLHLSQPAISGQIRKLEKSLGVRLFQRAGRGIVLTDEGRNIYRYADDIFALGREMQRSIHGGASTRLSRLTVGVAQSLPKSIIHELLEPTRAAGIPIQLVCREGPVEQLLTRLASHELDVLFADEPAPSFVPVRAFNHLLGESSVTLFAKGKRATMLRKQFPRSLDGQPFLLPADGTALRRALDDWFETVAIRPEIRGVFDDSALLKSFGQVGAGVFAAPTAVAAIICSQYKVQTIGTVDDIRERFFAISIDRKLRHPAVIAITKAARQHLFGRARH